jgi:predicted nucleotidyltransferase
VQGRVEELVHDVEKLAGDDLVAIVVAGGVARGEYREETSDVDLVIVLREAKRDTLAKLGAPLAVARAAARIEATILIQPEIARSSDVFPLWFEDLRAHRFVLLGVDPFADLVIGREHRRLRVEQELRDASLELRRAAADSRGEPRALAAAVERVVSRIRLPLRGLLDLLGVACDSSALDAVLIKAGKKLVAPTSRLGRPSAQPEESYDELAALLAKAVAAADTLDAEPS